MIILRSECRKSLIVGTVPKQILSSDVRLSQIKENILVCTQNSLLEK
jgi:hypothetical protein